MKPEKTNSIPFQIRIPHGLHAALKVSAAMQGVTMRVFVIKVLEENTKEARELMGSK